MSKECEVCYYFGKAADAPESVEEECMYVPNKDNDFDYIKPCERGEMNE